MILGIGEANQVWDIYSESTILGVGQNALIVDTVWLVNSLQFG